MAPPPVVPVPTWTRRIQGWSFLLFFVSLVVLTLAAVEVWNAGDLVMSGYLAGLASVAPLLLVVLVYYGLPVWGITVPLSSGAVADALASAARGRTVEPVAEREGPFTRCVSVVRFEDPSCTVGWSTDPASPTAAQTREVTVVVLRPETRDRKALAALRESLARSLVEATGPTA